MLRLRLQQGLIFFLPIFTLLLILRKVLFGGEIFFSGDVILQFYQYFKLFAVSNGVSIAQSILSGFPMDTTIAGGWYYPISKLFINWFGVIDGYHILTLINMIVAYTATYIYARVIKLQHLTAVLVASIFIFSGQLMKWLTVLPNTNYYFTLPIVLICAEVFWKSILINKSSRYILAGFSIIVAGVFLGVAWLAGHTQFVVYIHIFLALYFLLKYLQSRSLKVFVTGGLGLGFTYLVSALIGYPAIKSILELSQISSRSMGVSLSEFFSKAYLPYDLINFFIPSFNPPYVPVSSMNLYIGIIPVLLLFFSFIIYRQLPNKIFRFYCIVFLFCFFASFKYSPIGYLLHVLPFLDAFRSISRIMFIGQFASAIVVGYGVEFILSQRLNISHVYKKYINLLRKFFVYIFLPIVAIFSIIKLFFSLQLQQILQTFFLESIYPKTSGLPQDHYLSLIAQYVDQALEQFYIGSASIIVFIIISVLSWYTLKHSLSLKKNVVAILLIVVLLVDFSAVYANKYQTIDREVLTEPPSTAEYILAQEEESQFRIFSLFPGITEYNELLIGCPEAGIYDQAELQQMMLTPNVNIWHSIDSVDGYENLMTSHTSELLAYIGSERATTGDLLATADLSVEERIKIFVARRNILRMMNVKYIITHYEIDHPDFEEVFTESVGACETEVSVYELANPWPRYFLTQTLGFPTNDFDSVISQLQSDVDLGTVVLEKEINITASTSTASIILESQQYGDTMKFLTATDKEAVLHVGNTWLPGWQAKIDGEAVEILKSNYAFMAVIVPAGEHEISFEYIP